MLRCVCLGIIEGYEMTILDCCLVKCVSKSILFSVQGLAESNQVEIVKVGSVGA